MAAVASYELVPNKPVSSIRLEDGSVSSASESSSRILSRRETEQILDYYQSEDAGRAYIDPKSAYSQDSHTTQSEQDYPSEGIRPTLRPPSAGKDANVGVGRTSIDSVASSASGGVQRRTSQRSARGGDRRRMAIVETDSAYESQGSLLRAQMSYTSESSYHLLSDSGLLARRGVDSSRLEGLALMAPADVHLPSFTDLSPVPSSAPATGGLPTGTTTPKADAPSGSHHRSMSDLQSRKKTAPRDVGIVGTISPPRTSRTEASSSEASERGGPATTNYDQGEMMDRSLTAPVFQTPKSRSPSPLPPTSEPSPLEAPNGEQSQSVRDGVRPSSSIGQAKEAGNPVAGPVFVDLTSSVPVFRPSPKIITSGLPVTEPPPNELHGDHPQRNLGRLLFKPNQAGLTYLHYQPGIHATAGPLPSPPRHILTQISNSPPPRPPRLLTPLSTARRNDLDQLQESKKPPPSDGSSTSSIVQQATVPIAREGSEFSIAAVSVSSSESEDRSREESQPAISPTEPEDVEGTPQALSFRKGSHVREGAFPASSVFLSRPSKPPPRNQSHSLNEIEATEKEDLPRSDVVLPPAVAKLPRMLKRSRSRSNLRREEEWASESLESGGDGLDETSPPSSYPSSREGSIRLSTANVTSDDGHVGVDRRRASLPAPPSEPQKLFHTLPRTPSFLFTRNKSSPSPQPATARRAPSAWPEAMNFHQVLTRKTAAERALGYAAKMIELAREETGLRDWLVLSARKERRAAPASLPLAASPLPRGSIKHLRLVSRGSMASEITFPIRADSYTATDLSLRSTTEIASPISPPSLPYPSLAHGVGIRNHPMHSSTQSDTSSWGATSPTNSSRGLGGVLFASLGRKTSLRKDRTLGSASSNKLISSRQGAVPPQPRPIKIVATPTIPGGPRPPARRANSVIPARASGENPRSETQVFSMPPHTPGASTTLFDSQVQKLSDLLPNADKDVLAIYLRRANNQNPMLAIGAYLEDEKQGTLLSV